MSEVTYIYYETPEQRAFRTWWESLDCLTQKMWILYWENLPTEYIYSIRGGNRVMDKRIGQREDPLRKTLRESKEAQEKRIQDKQKEIEELRENYNFEEMGLEEAISSGSLFTKSDVERKEIEANIEYVKEWIEILEDDAYADKESFIFERDKLETKLTKLKEK